MNNNSTDKGDSIPFSSNVIFLRMEQHKGSEISVKDDVWRRLRRGGSSAKPTDESGIGTQSSRRRTGRACFHYNWTGRCIVLFRSDNLSHRIPMLQRSQHNIMRGMPMSRMPLVEHAALVTVQNKSCPASPRLATEPSPHLVLTVKDVAINDREFLSSLWHHECHSIHPLRAWSVHRRV